MRVLVDADGCPVTRIAVRVAAEYGVSCVVFCDMAIYSMVKNNTFNGMNLPAIYLKKQDGSIQLVRKFGYEDFKTRLS